MHLPHEWLRTLWLLASVSGVCFHGMVDNDNNNDNDNDNDNVFLKYDIANRGVTRRFFLMVRRAVIAHALASYW